MDEAAATALHFRTAWLPSGWASDVRVTIR